MKKLNIPILVIAMALAMGLLGCQQGGEEVGESELRQPEITTNVKEAVAILHPTAGNTVSGTVTFSQLGEGVRIVAELEGLTPGEHGFHIHEYGDCRAPDATSAGGHFNPENNTHAGPTDLERHAGDLGNIEADAGGKAAKLWIDQHLALNGEHSVVGRAVVVHAGKDDLTSQPSGAAGARVACGVIGIVQPEQSQ